MNSDNPDVWRAEAEDKIARLHAAALKHLPPEEVKLRQQIETKDAEIKGLHTKAGNLLFRLDACLRIAQTMMARPMPNSVLDRAFTEIARYADLDNNI